MGYNESRNATPPPAQNQSRPRYNAPRAATPFATDRVGDERFIRISGSPLGLRTYGLFGSAVEFALVDGWLSQAEISFLKAGAFTQDYSDVDYDCKYLFWAFTGHFPPAKSLDERWTYDNIKTLADKMKSRRNTYLQWRNTVISWTTMVKVAISIPSMAQQITAEPDISSDDKMNLRGLLYLAALRNLGGTTGPPTATITITDNAGNVVFVGPLSQAEAQRYDQLAGGGAGHVLNALVDRGDSAVFNLAQTVLNRFNVINY